MVSSSSTTTTTSSNFSNPCDLVRSTCRQWIEENEKQTLVKIRHDKIPTLAYEILQSKKKEIADKDNTANQATATTKPSSSNNDNGEDNWIEWDSEEWHYNGIGFKGTESQRQERVALYLLALDAINFCFWPTTDSTTTSSTGEDNLLEYEHLAMALKGLAEEDHANKDYSMKEYAFSPNNLATMTKEKMTNSLQPYLKHTIPNTRKRVELWNEIGTVLLSKYNGSIMELLQCANNNASKVVELVASSFPGFQDEVYRNTQRYVFLKRAQIFVGDINAALQLNLDGMDQLTTFADYRVPQILRHWNVLEYSPTLAGKVDSKIEIDAGSVEEISIRAGTVVAVEELVKVLNQIQTNGTKDENNSLNKTTPTTESDQNIVFTDVTVDWYLWQVGERMNQEGLMKPFHRVRTHFY
jgi:hypothetical protein